MKMSEDFSIDWENFDKKWEETQKEIAERYVDINPAVQALPKTKPKVGRVIKAETVENIPGTARWCSNQVGWNIKRAREDLNFYAKYGLVKKTPILRATQDGYVMCYVYSR